MNTPVEPSVSPLKKHMLRFIEKHPNQEIYRFAAGPGVDAWAARQAGVEVTFEQHVEQLPHRIGIVAAKVYPGHSPQKYWEGRFLGSICQQYRNQRATVLDKFT